MRGHTNVKFIEAKFRRTTQKFTVKYVGILQTLIRTQTSKKN